MASLEIKDLETLAVEAAAVVDEEVQGPREAALALLFPLFFLGDTAPEPVADVLDFVAAAAAAVEEVEEPGEAALALPFPLSLCCVLRQASSSSSLILMNSGVKGL